MTDERTAQDEQPTDVGEGYPEEGQPGTGVHPKTYPEDDGQPGHDASQRRNSDDGDAGQATGNPKAAGG